MKKMLELRKGNYVAIVNNERLVEIEASSKEEAAKRYVNMYGFVDNISICTVPDCITVI